ncbi:hypothetical protein BDB01DRAFT_513596 [Pilobolus umbonatus]|nr:hypothetical protein BDB01DRAFT_513596 [Pilobolus umbonatus]
MCDRKRSFPPSLTFYIYIYIFEMLFDGFRKLFKRKLVVVDPEPVIEPVIVPELPVEKKRVTLSTLSDLSVGKYAHDIKGRELEEDIAYILPNDDEEIDRLREQHEVVKYAFQSNYHAPIRPLLEMGISVFDSGCGPASWIMDMAETYPSSQFTGIDIAFVFPSDVQLSNVDLQVCHIGRDIPFKDESYDYFHQRLLGLGLTAADWDKALENAYRILKLGGFIELGEPNMKTYQHMGPLTKQMQDTLARLSESKGMVPDVAVQLEDRLRIAGFKNIDTVQIPYPLNHTNRVGDMFWKDSVRMFTNIRPVLAADNSLFEDEDYFNEHMASIGIECNERKTNILGHIVCAQKPWH